MKMRNNFRERLEKQDYMLGAFIASCNPTNVEILGMNGLDFVILDMEHSQLGLETMVDMIRTAEMNGMVPITRVYTMETKLMRRILDIGAHGIMVPMVSTTEDAHYTIDAVKYPPLGKRGMNGGRGPKWGDYENYIYEANNALVTIFQCETREGLENIEEIAKTPGLDCIFIGTADLSMELGYPWEVDHPKVRAAIDKILKVCQENNVLPGIVTTSAEDAVRRVKQGFRVVTCMNDLAFFKKQSNAEIQNIRTAIEIDRGGYGEIGTITYS